MKIADAASSPRQAALCSLVLLTVACGDGVLAGGGDKNGKDPSGKGGDGDHLVDTPGGVNLACDGDVELSPTPLLKLSTVQYKNTVRDLLARFDLSSIAQEVETVMSSLPNDSLGEGFRGLDDRMTLEHVQGHFNVGVRIGDAIAADPTLLENVASSCAALSDDGDTCWDDFSSDFLRAVYRRPLSAAEEELYATIRADETDIVNAIRSAVVVALSSPRFVYHVEIDGTELGEREDLLALDAYEVASRLSYTFWQTMPDEELFNKAADGSLLEESVYAEQLLRVWDDERTHATIEQFWTEWLKLEKFTGFETARPAFQALAEGTNIGQPGHDYYGDMVQEVLDLTNLYIFTEPGSLADLLRSNVSVTPSEDLAALYGVTPWDGSSSFPTFPEGERSGLLQRAALLVSNLEQTNPFHRGALIRKAVLCDPLPDPDPNALPPGALDPPPFDPEQTTRERFSAKVDGNSLCEGCHVAFSPIGYVLESYDALGRYRTLERVFDEQTGELLAELPIDTSGDVKIQSSTDSPVENAAEMNERIVTSGKVEACMAESYFKYVARRAKTKASYDTCVLQDLSAVLSEADGGLAAAFQRLARVSTFFTKKVGPQ